MVPLNPSNVHAKFSWNKQNKFGEKCKNVIFFRFKMATISRNLEQLGRNFALHFGTSHDMCLQNIIGSLQIEGARSRTKIGEHGFDPTVVVAAASNQSDTYRSLCDLNSFKPFCSIIVQKKCKNAVCLTFKWPQFNKVEIIFPDNVLLSPSNVPTTFYWNNQNRFGEKCKIVIFKCFIIK